MSLNSKTSLREQYRRIRSSFDPSVKKDFDDKITQGFLSLDEYGRCEKLLTFVSKDIEVNTADIIAKAFKDGKTVAVPRCGENNTMDFYVIESIDDLERGYFDIHEPKTYCKKLSDYDNAVCLVPGLSFDERGYRIGFGGGYYDRFLSKHNVISIGVCYSDCVADKLPADEYDRPVNIIVTNNKIIRKDNGNG